MKALDPFRFLFFGSDAIRRIAGDPWAFMVAAVFVASAGVARNYDHLDLARDWEWVVAPFIVSIVSSVWIFRWNVRVLGLPARALGRQYLAFLALFWMTAPCAWLYAIPVELWSSMVDAAKWNVAFMVVVSLWRVALITFVVRVLTGNHLWRCVVAVVTPAAIELAVFAMLAPIGGIMGGVRLSPDAPVIAVTGTIAFNVAAFGSIALVLIHCRKREHIEKANAPMLSLVAANTFPLAAMFLAAGLLLSTLVAALATVQPAVRLTREIGRLGATENWPAVVELPSRTQRSDYSPWHFFPPRPYARAQGIDEIVEVAAGFGDDAPPWLVDEWHENARLDLEIIPWDWVYFDLPLLERWSETENGREFLATNRDRILELTSDDQREAIGEIVDGLETR